jgi:hypothetical protein
LCLSARNWWAVETSAERSEAREDGTRRHGAFRVASPLVMATRGADARRNDVLWALRVCPYLKPLPPASQGGSATRHTEQLLRSSLRLCFAPPSSVSHLGIARASKLRSRLRALVFIAVAAAAAPSGAITPERASCEAGCERSNLRALLKRNAGRA